MLEGPDARVRLAAATVQVGQGAGQGPLGLGGDRRVDVGSVAQTQGALQVGDRFSGLAKGEVAGLREELERLTQTINVLLLPSDPNDAKNILLEIRAGTGGEEATLFAAELFRMYGRFAERQRWKLDIMSRSESASGGLKEVIATIDGLPAGGQAGARPFIIPVFIPMSGCPHRCAFCNQTAITGVKPHAVSPSAVTHAIDTFLPFVRDRGRTVQIAFYGGNFLGLPERQLHDLLAIATAHVTHGDVASIRFSTRPDTITESRLAAIRDFPVHTIELGVQSMDDRVLARANRGHNAQCTLNAARMVASAGYALGLQMMTGLPGDTVQGALHTAECMLKLAPDLVRIPFRLVEYAAVHQDRE